MHNTGYHDGMSKEPQPITTALRDGIVASGMSRTAIARAVGVHKGTISRFMSGKAGLSLAVADKLAAFLALRLAPEREDRK